MLAVVLMTMSPEPLLTICQSRTPTQGLGSETFRARSVVGRLYPSAVDGGAVHRGTMGRTYWELRLYTGGFKGTIELVPSDIDSCKHSPCLGERDHGPSSALPDWHEDQLQ
jgi:hypothetical protein